MVEHNLAKVDTRVRFPSPAPNSNFSSGKFFLYLNPTLMNLMVSIYLFNNQPCLNSSMKITTRTDPETEESVIEIRTKHKERTEAILKLLSSFDGFFIGQYKQKTYKIAFFDVLYFSFDEEKTYIFTKTYRFESEYRLYEIPLISNHFMRVHKSFVVNIHNIASFQNSAHGRMELTLINGERVIVSRFYVETMKIQLGGFKG